MGGANGTARPRMKSPRKPRTETQCGSGSSRCCGRYHAPGKHVIAANQMRGAGGPRFFGLSRDSSGNTARAVWRQSPRTRRVGGNIRRHGVSGQDVGSCTWKSTLLRTPESFFHTALGWNNSRPTPCVHGRGIERNDRPTPLLRGLFRRLNMARSIDRAELNFIAVADQSCSPWPATARGPRSKARLHFTAQSSVAVKSSSRQGQFARHPISSKAVPLRLIASPPVPLYRRSRRNEARPAHYQLLLAVIRFRLCCFVSCVEILACGE